MEVLFVSPSFYPATYYGGPVLNTYFFCESLAETNQVRLRVLTTDADGPRRRIQVSSIPEMHNDTYRVYYCRRIVPSDISPKLLLRLPGMIRRADVVHLNGVYSFTTLPTLALCRLFRKPVVWAPLGALQRWPGTTRTTMKAIWDKICDWLCDPERVALHLNSEEERLESLCRINRATSVVIRNGIDIPKLGRAKGPNPRGSIRLLYIGRLHPIKGIENLLRAIKLVKGDVRLSICGEGEVNYQKRLRSLATELGISDRVQFHGPVDEEAKKRHFQEADLCVVPSFKESFCTVVVESLAHAVPVIASTGTPWRRIEEIGCGIWVGNEAEELSKAIERAVVMPLAEMGQRGRAWMKREYSWTQVAEEVFQQYCVLIHRYQGKHIEIAPYRDAA